ncbi:MAG: PEP-CTERM sorting domain-containing protein [Planctomycetaceae bacterium]|nr:PEP-CTERM sorting domain-containing protein [Planctomycetaceae bacterium]
MKKALLVCALLASIVGTANAMAIPTTNAYVATVLGSNAYTIQNGGTQLYFHPQPDTQYTWNENNGSASETLATYTYNGVTYNRDGMKTFACSSVAYGKTLGSVKIEFDYYTGADPTTGINIVYYPTVNFFVTDGTGHYAIWSATSGGTPFSTAATGETGWSRFTLDLTSLSNSTWGQMNEYNGGTTAKPYWDTIKNWTIAGFYDYQRTPEGGFEAWDNTLWADITNVGTLDTTLNQYGISLSWGDTVGGMYEDGNGEIGSAANRPYGQAGRMIKDYTISVGETTYDVVFVPEPATIAILGLGAFCLIRKRK